MIEMFMPFDNTINMQSYIHNLESRWYKFFRISILWDLTDLQDIDSIYITLSL